MRRRERPLLLEYAVFGSALVLSLIVGYYAYQRFAGRTARVTFTETMNVSRPGGSISSEQAANAPPRRELQGSGTVSAVSIIPGVKSTAGNPAKRKKR